MFNREGEKLLRFCRENDDLAAGNVFRPLMSLMVDLDIHLRDSVFSHALGIVRKARGGSLTETELSLFCQSIDANLTRVLSSGERNPETITRAVLLGVLMERCHSAATGAPVPCFPDQSPSFA